MKKKYHTVGTVPKFNKKNCKKRQKRHPYHTKIHDRTLSWLDTGTSIKSSRVKLVSWTKTNK